jgi:chaperonin GroEL
VILAYHILLNATSRVSAGYNPMLMRKGIELASKDIKQALTDLSQPVFSASELKEVATISSGDPDLGALIADTIEDVGINGGITVEEYQGIGVESEVVEGFYFNKGYDSVYFMTEPDETAVLRNTNVLIVEDKITNIGQLENILEIIANSDNRKVLIIGTITGQALHQLIVNKVKGTLEVVTVSPAIFGDQKQAHLEDLAILTGGKVIASGTLPADLDESVLGFAKEVVISKDSTTIIANKPQQVTDRLQQIETAIKSEKNQFRKDNMKKRLAMLEGKIAIIRVGGESEAVAHEKKLRVDDAVHATQAARDHGILPGGATALVHAKSHLKTLKIKQADILEGYNVVLQSLDEPLRQLNSNAGLPADYNVEMVKRSAFGWGYNVLEPTTEPVYLMGCGVIDPTLVIKQVVENACASAGLALTNNATITFEKDDKPTDSPD